jgi:hypothetical protein
VAQRNEMHKPAEPAIRLMFRPVKAIMVELLTAATQMLVVVAVELVVQVLLPMEMVIPPAE